MNTAGSGVDNSFLIACEVWPALVPGFAAGAYVLSLVENLQVDPYGLLLRG